MDGRAANILSAEGLVYVDTNQFGANTYIQEKQFRSTRKFLWYSFVVFTAAGQLKIFPKHLLQAVQSNATNQFEAAMNASNILMNTG